MEQNQEKKMNKKSLISLVACVAVVAVCALCTVGVLITRNLGVDKEAVTNTENVVIEKNEAGEIVAANEATLRQLLAENKKYTIAIEEDIYVSKPMEVNGTKTLVGSKSIIMDLNTEAKANLLVVTADAKLILDGPTIDGNGVVSGIAVKDGGKLECLSGNIVYPMPYGIVTEGVVNVEDILIDRSMHTGIYVETGGELNMTGGKITNCIQTGIATSKNAYAKVSKDVVIQKSSGSLFYNFGTLDITGGTYSDSYSNCIFNKGELNIVSESDKVVEFFNSGRSVISSVAGTKVTIDGLYVHDITAHAMNLEKDSVADVKNVLVENTGKSCFYTNGSKLTMKDVEIKDTKTVCINLVNKSTVDLESITLTNGGHRGIINDSSNVTMKDITIDNMVGAGIITIGDKSVTTIENTKISKVGKSGIGITGGTVTVKNVEIKDAAGTSIYTTTDKSKTIVDGAKLVNSGKSAIGVSIGTLTAKNVEINGTKNTGVYIQKGAKLDLSDTTIKGANKHGIANYFGTVVAKNVNIEAPTNAGILNQGTLTGEKVTINKAGSRAMSLTDASTTNITGLVINESKNQSVYAHDAKSVHISDFQIDKSGQSAFRITKSTDVLLKSGKITNANGDGIWVSEDAKMKVQDTVITAPTKYGVEVVGTAEVTAENVEVNNARAGFVNNGGTILGKVLAVNDSTSRSLNLIGKSTTNIDGLTVKNAGDQAVYVEDTTKVVLKNIDIDTTKGAAIRVANAKDVSIKDGSIKNAGTDGVYAGKDAAMKVDAVAITDTTGYGLYCEKGNLTAVNVNVNNAKAGIVNKGGIIAGNTVSIADTVGRGMSLTEGSTTDITGLTVKNTGDQAVYVDGTTKVALKDIAIDKTKSAAIRVANADNVSIKGGTIKNVGTDAVYAGKDAAMKVEAVAITDTTGYGLYCEKGNLTAVNVNVNNAKAGIVNKGGIIAGNTVSVADTVGRGMSLIEGSTTDITGLTVKNTGDQAVYVDGTTKVVLKDITIDKTKSAAIRVANADNVSIKGGTINNVGTDAVYAGKDAAMKIEAVVITGTTGYGLYSEKGNLTAIDVNVTNAKAGIVNKGGIIAGNTVSVADTVGRGMSLTEGSTTDITGLTVKNTGDQGVYVENSKVKFATFEVDKTKSAAFSLGKTKDIDETAVEDVTLTNGTISNSGSTGIYLAKTATANVTGVTVEKAGQHGIQNAGGKLTGTTVAINQSQNRALTMGTDSEVTINGLDITGTGIGNEENKDAQAIYISGGKAEITGFEISDALQAAVRIRNAKDVKLTDGTINATTYGIYTSEDASVIAEDVRILRQEGNKDALIHVESTTSVTLQNGENTVAENQSLVDGQGLDGQGVVVEGTFNLNGGTIQNNNTTVEGAGIFVKENGTFIMNGGNVDGNKNTLEGAGVYVEENASFVMNSGVIQNNETENTSGGVAVRGAFTLNDGAIQNNKASKGAGVMVRATGTFTMNDGTIQGNEATLQGGGIFTLSADTTVHDGNITNNSAVDGAGIYLNSGNTRIKLAKEATVSDNKATGNGGGLYVGSGNNASLDANVIKAEITTNEAKNGGGIYVNGSLKETWSDLNIHDNKATGNGGGLYVNSAADFKVSGEIKKNTATNGGGVYTYNKGQLTVTDGSIAENLATKNGSGVYVGAGDYEGAKANAKPFTLSGGSISGHGTEAIRSTVEGNAVYVANKATFKLTGTGDISSNYSNKQGNAVYVLAGGSFIMDGGIVKENNTTNTGSVSVYGSFTMNGGDIKENHASANAGGVIIRNTGSFSMTGGTVDGNTTNGNGGGIYIQSTDTEPTISGGTIKNNEAANGGGIYVGANSSAETFYVKSGVLITANKASVAGAGVYANKGTFTMEGGSITNHGISTEPSAAKGAGVYINSKLSMTGGTISNNYTSANGGGVYLANGAFNMSGSSTLQNNTTTAEGGAVYIAGGTYTVNNGTANTIYQNEANNGGAVAVVGGTFHLKKAYIKDNQATTNGGGVYVASGIFKTSTVDIKEISSNTAGNFGGGLYLAAGATCELDGSKLSFDTSSAVRGKDMYLAGQITLKSTLSDEISISPATYSTDTVIATGTADTFKTSMKKFAVEKATDNTYWIVGEDGKLAQAAIGVGANGVGYATLAEAVVAAANGDTITLTQNQTITEGIAVAKDLTITSATSVTISTNFTSSADLFTVAEGASLTINGAADEGNEITLAGDANTNYVINNSGTLLMSNVNITGGVRGIQNTAGTVGSVENPLTNVSVSNASQYGVANEGGTVQIQSGEIRESKSVGLYVNQGTVTVKNTIIDNTNLSNATSKPEQMRGIYAEACTLNLYNVTVQNFVGSKPSSGNSHGIHLVGAILNVPSVKIEGVETNALTINGVYGHGLAATSNSIIKISNIIIDGKFGNANKTRAGVYVADSTSNENNVTQATINNCGKQIQLKNAAYLNFITNVKDQTSGTNSYKLDGTLDN